jgi:hypothetical protein
VRGTPLSDEQVQEWISSAAKWEHWRIIEIKRVEPVLCLLSDELVDRIKSVQPKPAAHLLSQQEEEAQRAREAAQAGLQTQQKAMAGLMKVLQTGVQVAEQLSRSPDESDVTKAVNVTKSIVDGFGDLFKIVAGTDGKV